MALFHLLDQKLFIHLHHLVHSLYPHQVDYHRLNVLQLVEEVAEVNIMLVAVVLVDWCMMQLLL